MSKKQKVNLFYFITHFLDPRYRLDFHKFYIHIDSKALHLFDLFHTYACECFLRLFFAMIRAMEQKLNLFYGNPL